MQDSQIQSALLRCPLEIRQAIYYSYFDVPDRVHASIRKTRLRLSACFEVGNGDEDGERCGDGLESRQEPNAPDQEVHVRRVQSSWGPHWKCEEIALHRSGSNNHNQTGLYLVCKRMYAEYFGVFARSVEIQVMDLETINCLDTVLTTRFTTLTVLSSLPVSVTRLSILLKLPLRLCKVLKSGRGTTAVDGEIQKNLSIWMKLGSTLGQFENLRVLNIWLDHDKSCTWTVVDERAILSPFNQIFSNSNIDTSVSLPKLHPKFERDELHYLSADQAPFYLRRRVRQRYHVGKDGRGGLRVLRKPDFPEFDRDLEGFAPGEVEEIERSCWKGGMDYVDMVEFLVLSSRVFEHPNI